MEGVQCIPVAVSIPTLIWDAAESTPLQPSLISVKDGLTLEFVQHVPLQISWSEEVMYWNVASFMNVTVSSSLEESGSEGHGQDIAYACPQSARRRRRQ